MNRTARGASRFYLATVAWCAVLGGAAARADVVTFANGNVMKGIVEEGKPDSPTIRFTGADVTANFPRERIKSIQKEPIAQGYTHIGDDHRAKERLDRALEAYEKALREDPNFQPAKDRIASVKEVLAARDKMQRRDDLERVNEIGRQAQALIDQGEFEKAEKALEDASKLLPDADQQAALKKVVAQLYLAWAKERRDKFDGPGAEEKLNLALAADEENPEIVKEMIELWEGRPEKREQVLRVYETVLERTPDDEVLRLKVADLNYDLQKFDEALPYYLEVYSKSPSYKGTSLEQRVITLLDQMHKRKASERDYEKAIFYHKLLTGIDPDTDPTARAYYEYMQRAQSAPPNTAENMVALASFAEERGLDSFALENYRRALEVEPKNETAQRALDGYALKIITEARGAMARKEFYLAKTFANQVVQDFPDSKEAALRAREIVGTADQEIVRDKKDRCTQAKDYIARGDIYYQQAMGFYRDIFDTERRGTALLSTPKSDAIRHFQYAIDAYNTALQMCPEMQNEPSSLVAPNLSESQAILKRLKAPPPTLGFDQSRKPLR